MADQTVSGTLVPVGVSDIEVFCVEVGVKFMHTDVFYVKTSTDNVKPVLHTSLISIDI